jgi:sugar phosphate permease
MTTRRPFLPWVVWGVAALAYAMAVINRSSLSALGPAAQEHFGIDATTLAMFAVIQLVVYAALQIPVGVLLDRFGPTILILSGGVLMLAGQLVMATVSEVWFAILARVLVGAGDACTFISVIRMLPEWFSVRQIPTLSQFTGLIGQAGQLVSVTPLALLVGAIGWTGGFVGVVAVGFLVTLLGAVVLRDRPGTGTLFERVFGRTGSATRGARSLGQADTTGTLTALAPPPTSLMPATPPRRRRRIPGAGFWQSSRRLLAIPGVRLAFWVHFTSPFAATVFILLWGTPFLTGGVGLDAGAARSLLSLTILSSMAAGLLLGPVTSRFLEKRVVVNIGITLAVVVTWVAVLLWPGTPPLWLLIVLVVVMPIGGPASLISFEVARSHTPRSFAGFSTGLVNTGGFISSLLVILLIGLVLDVQGAGSPELYTLDAFKWAFAVQIPFWAIGLTMIFVERRRTLLWMQEHGRSLR